MRVPLVLGAVALFASSCGGSSTVETGDTVAPEVTEAPATTEAPTTTSEAPTTTGKEAIGESSVDVAKYCALNIQADEESDLFFATLDDQSTAQVAAFFLNQKLILEEAIGVAEPDIRPSLSVVYQQFSDLDEVLASNGYDFVSAQPEMASILEGGLSDSEKDALDLYDLENCGIAIDDDDDDDDSEESSGDSLSPTDEEIAVAEALLTELEDPTARDQFIVGFMSQLPNLSQEKAECFFDNLTPKSLATFIKMGTASPEDLNLGSPVMAELFTVMDTCDMTFADLS